MTGTPLADVSSVARPCRALALQLSGRSIRVRCTRFDEPGPNREVRVSGRTYHLGYDRTAAKDAYDQVQRFLKTYLQ